MITKRVVAEGAVYGYLTVIAEQLPYETKSGTIVRQVLCRCECGNERAVTLSYLLYGKKQTCGLHCGKSFGIGWLNYRHGRALSKEYRAWWDMKAKCLDPKNRLYNRSGGGVGYSVCKEWLDSFDNFFTDMGLSPESRYVLRLNNEGAKVYCKDNCCWGNHRKGELLRGKTLVEWEKYFKVSRSYIRVARKYFGLTTEGVLQKLSIKTGLPLEAKEVPHA